MVVGEAINGVASGSRQEGGGFQIAEGLAACSGFLSLPDVFKYMLKWCLPPHLHVGDLDLDWHSLLMWPHLPDDLRICFRASTSVTTVHVPEE